MFGSAQLSCLFVSHHAGSYNSHNATEHYQLFLDFPCLVNVHIFQTQFLFKLYSRSPVCDDTLFCTFIIEQSICEYFSLIPYKLSIVNHHIFNYVFILLLCINHQVKCIVCAYILDNKLLLILLKQYFDICFSGYLRAKIILGTRLQFFTACFCPPVRSARVWGLCASVIMCCLRPQYRRVRTNMFIDLSETILNQCVGIKKITYFWHMFIFLLILLNFFNVEYWIFLTRQVSKNYSKGRVTLGLNFSMYSFQSEPVSSIITHAMFCIIILEVRHVVGRLIWECEDEPSVEKVNTPGKMTSVRPCRLNHVIS